MTALVIDSAQRRALRAQAHHLKPVVMIAAKGLTPALLAEIDRALTAHELIKIRVAGAEREVRARYLEEICATLDCAPVQMLGNLLLVWRPNPEKEGAEERAARKTKEAPASSATPPSTAAAFIQRARRHALKKGHS
jgi:putative YhbY family RNA-binding protein